MKLADKITADIRSKMTDLGIPVTSVIVMSASEQDMDTLRRDADIVNSLKRHSYVDVTELSSCGLSVVRKVSLDAHTTVPEFLVRFFEYKYPEGVVKVVPSEEIHRVSKNKTMTTALEYPVLLTVSYFEKIDDGRSSVKGTDETMFLLLFRNNEDVILNNVIVTGTG